VVTDDGGNPGFRLHGKALDALAVRGITSVHLTMTHDAGVACAFVVTEGHA
jgi:holo-[acyl-carrier protein] synthase